MATTITLANIKTRVRNKLGDDSFDDTTLTEFANDVNREICNNGVWPFMEASFTGTVAQGYYTFDLTASIPDLQQFIDFIVISPTNRILYLDYMTYQEFDKRYPYPGSQNQQQPQNWTSFDNELIFGPGPMDQTYTIQLRYLKLPKTITSESDTFDVPDEFSELLVLGMYARALEAADQPDYAANQYGRFQQQLATFHGVYDTRQLGQPLVIQNQRSLRYKSY